MLDCSHLYFFARATRALLAPDQSKYSPYIELSYINYYINAAINQRVSGRFVLSILSPEYKTQTIDATIFSAAIS